MSGYYPEGSMRGSGIYAQDLVVDMECAHCGHTWETDVTTDDWGNVDEDVTCPVCNEVFNFTMEPYEPEFDDERSWNE